MKRLLLTSCMLATAVGIFYAGGWQLIWGEHLSLAGLLMDGDLELGKNFLFGGRFIAILVNSKYYGLMLTNRFFASPALSYIAFGVGFFMIIDAINELLKDKPPKAKPRKRENQKEEEEG